MNELLHRTVKIVFNPSAGTNSGIIGTTCVINGFEDGFVVVVDLDKKISYYAMNCIKSITLLDCEDEGKVCL